MAERVVPYLLQKGTEFLIGEATARLRANFGKDPSPDNPYVYHRMNKELGIITASDMRVPIGLYDSLGDKTINTGERVVCLALPPVPLEKRSFTEVDHSLALLAKYIKIHRIQSQYVIAVTYRQLARASTRWGFEVSPDKLDYGFVEAVRDEYEEYRKMGFNKAGRGRISMIFQPTSDFIQRFGVAGRVE